jgi:uracil-DNA glycosylase
MGQLEWITTTPEELAEELRVHKPRRKIRLRECEGQFDEVPCGKCKIEGRDKIVPGDGVPGRAMFVGMCPGEDEAKEGKPFVGKSGKLLRKIIAEVGFGESDCYFTNVVKCRLIYPEGN